MISPRAKTFVVLALSAVLWLFLVFAWHNPEAGFLFGVGGVVLLWLLVREPKPTAERQAEQNRPRA